MDATSIMRYRQEACIAGAGGVGVSMIDVRQKGFVP